MSDDYWKQYEGKQWNPENVGDTITGYVTDRQHGVAGGKQHPLLILRVNDAGDTKEVLASQTMLKQTLADLNVQVGDKIKITLTELRNTGQPSPMKCFDVQHRVGEAHVAPAVEAPAVPPAPPVVDGADLSDHSNEPF